MCLFYTTYGPSLPCVAHLWELASGRITLATAPECLRPISKQTAASSTPTPPAVFHPLRRGQNNPFLLALCMLQQEGVILHYTLTQEQNYFPLHGLPDPKFWINLKILTSLSCFCEIQSTSQRIFIT